MPTDTKWVILIVVLALIFGGLCGWNLGRSYWEGVYLEDIAQLKYDIEQKYGLRELDPGPHIYIHDLVGGDESRADN